MNEDIYKIVKIENCPGPKFRLDVNWKNGPYEHFYLKDSLLDEKKIHRYLMKMHRRRKEKKVKNKGNKIKKLRKKMIKEVKKHGKNSRK